jgi:hypothetical protein
MSTPLDIIVARMQVEAIPPTTEEPLPGAQEPGFGRLSFRDQLSQSLKKGVLLGVSTDSC